MTQKEFYRILKEKYGNIPYEDVLSILNRNLPPIKMKDIQYEEIRVKTIEQCIKHIQNEIDDSYNIFTGWERYGAGYAIKILEEFMSKVKGEYYK